MSLFITQIIGPIFLILGVGMLLNKTFYSQAYTDLKERSIFVIFASVINLVLALVLILKHGLIWGDFYEIIVSLTAIAALIKGLHLALAPKSWLKMANSLISEQFILIGGGIICILGIWITWISYFV